MNKSGYTIDVSLNGSLGDFVLDCSFSAPANGVSVLFGPSGCGKTTVLHSIAGLNRLDGRICVAADIWQDTEIGHFLKTHKRSIGYVFQEDNLFPHLNVKQNLMIGVPNAPAQQSFDEYFTDIIDMFGLQHLLERSTRALSGGERQRIAMARTLLKKPALILMDEPLSGLDQHTKDEILPYLDRMLQGLDIPMLYVSHDIQEVARIADHVILMAGGRVVASGETARILEQIDPRGSRDLGGVGTVVDAVVHGHMPSDHMTCLMVSEQQISVPEVYVPLGEHLRIYINARDVSLATIKPESISIRNSLMGHIADIKEIEGTAYVDVSVDVGGAVIRAHITRPAAKELSLSAGQKVYALIKSVTFDPRSLGRS